MQLHKEVVCAVSGKSEGGFLGECNRNQRRSVPEMVQAGATRLHTNAEYVNSLNVFPVPDGDTGTNMNLSMTSGAKAGQILALKK